MMRSTSRRRFSLIGAVAACAVLLSAMPVDARVGTGAEGRGVDALRRQDAGVMIVPVTITPWVEPDGVWAAVFSITGALPADAVLRYTIYRPIAGDRDDVRARIVDVANGSSPGPGLQNQVEQPAAPLTVDGQLTLTIPIRSRSGSSDRTLIPNPGVHPVTVSIVASDGAALGSWTLLMTRLAARSRPPLRLAITDRISVDPPFDPDGVPLVSDRTEAAVERIAAGSEFPGSGTTLTVEPALVDSLSRRPTTQSPLDALLKGVGDQPLLRATWSPIDIEGWARVGDLTEVQNQLVAGQRGLDVFADAAPVTSVWPIDPSMGPRSVAVMRSLGVDHLLLNADQVDLPSDLPTAGEFLRPLTIRSDQEIVDALVTDPQIAVLLALPVPDDRDGRAANIALALMGSAWINDPGDDALAALVDLSAMSAPRVTTFARQIAAASAETVDVVDPQTIFSDVAPLTRRRTSSRTEPAPAEATMRTPGNVSDLASVATVIRGQRQRVAAVQSMTTEPAADLDFGTQLLLAADRRWTTVERDRAIARVSSQVAATVAAIVIPTPRDITLTARRASVPIRIENGLDRPATIEIEFSTSRLSVDGGPRRTVTLQPGTNRVDIPVTVRTSGQFIIAVKVRTQNRGLSIGSTEIKVRSQVFGGIGFALGGGALLFLIGWWLATARRKRRRAARERHVSHIAADDPAIPSESSVDR